jgi:hypothetical protein
MQAPAISIKETSMSRNRMLSFVISSLLLFSGAASAEQRYFEFTGKVTRSEDPRLAPVGSTVRGSFNYDDATVGDYFPDMGLYDIDAELVAEVNGRILVSDRTSITLYDYNGGADIVWVHSTPGIMVDHKIHRTGYFGFSLYGSGLDSVNLPSSFDLGQFHLAEGALFLNDTDGVTLDFSIDTITNVPAPPMPCLKKNGKIDRHCKDKD